MRRVVIVGLGLIGGSLGMALRETAPGIDVDGVARRRETADQAVRRGAVERAGTDLQLVEGADMVVLACPLGATAAILEECLPHLSVGARVTDVGSVKREVVAHALSVLDQRRNPFLGGHPMAGKEVSGVAHAEAGIFRGRPWVFTPHHQGADAPFEDLVDAVRLIGAIPVVLTPRQHDRYVALVSHLPFLLSAAFLLSVGDQPDWPNAADLASTGFRDISRLGAGNPEMYAAITTFNRDEVLQAWGAFHLALDMLEAAIERQQGDALLELLSTARGTREAWAADHPEPA